MKNIIKYLLALTFLVNLSLLHAEGNSAKSIKGDYTS